MIKFISLSTAFFILMMLSGCNYHPRDSVLTPSPRPNPYIRKHEEFVARNRPAEIIQEQASNNTSLIVIDPGHGGDDFGTRSDSKPKYHEKSLNLTTALLLNDYLKKMGYQTLMTRTKDEFISLQKRAEIANDRQADLFVSIHYNSAPAKQADGIEVFYYKSSENKARTSSSKQLAIQVLNQLIKVTEAKSRGVKHENFAVIRETKMPAILIEGGFLTNEDEMEKIKSPSYVKTIAWGIATGIQSYLNGKP